MSTGKNYGALKLASLDSLYGAQREAAEAILRSVHAIAYDSFDDRHTDAGGVDDGPTRGRSPNDRSGMNRRDFERPHHVFTLDGPRGSGKTTLLQTLSGFLSLMRLNSDRIRENSREERSIAAGLRDLDLPAPRGAGNQHVALVLPIVFTEDMDPLETTMEAVFAQMENVLDDRIETQVEDRATLKALRDELRKKVGVAWTFSQKIGVETLSQDALDYQDFVNRRAEHNRYAYTRILTWRHYIERYLDAVGCELLVLLFDDSDLNPEAVQDILRAVRMYFCHPRIATILAVEFETLSWTMTARMFADEEKSIRALKTVDDALLSGYISQILENPDALLDKIMPHNLRHTLAHVSMGHLNHFFQSKETPTDQLEPSAPDAFGVWCRARSAAASNDDARLAWVLLEGPYKRLVGVNIRLTVVFKDATVDPTSNPMAALLRTYRSATLAVAVSRDLSDLGWLIESDRINPDWPGEHQDDVANLIDLGDYELQLVELWIDTQIAKAHFEVRNSALLQHWLPGSLLGRDTARELNDPGKLLGVAGRMRYEPLPRNCLYLYHFRRLAGVVFDELPSPSRYTQWLTTFEQDDHEFNDAHFRQAASSVADLASGSDEAVLKWFGTHISSVLAYDRTAPRAFSDHASLFTIGLFAASRHEVKNRKQFESVLLEIGEKESNFLEEFETFLTEFSDAIRTAERRRQEALLIWASALELCLAGYDNARLERPAPRSQLVVSLVATAAHPRFPILVHQTVQQMERGGRDALLLAWSLVPLLPAIHEYGADYIDSSASPEQWKRLAKAYADLLQSMRRDLPFLFEEADSSDLPPDAGTLQESKPSNIGWDYADLPLKMLREIKNEIEATINAFETVLRPDLAAGVLRSQRSWKTWPTDQGVMIASLLGTSKQWALDNVVADA